MDIQKKNRNDERRILTAMIVDSYVLGRITSRWIPKGLFSTRWANLVAGWCVIYYEQYSEAPKNQIENLYEVWASKNTDPTTIKLVEKFLDSLSDEYEALQKEINSEYTLDLAGQYFNKVKLEKLTQTIRGSLDTGDIEAADNLISSYNRIELGTGEGIHVFKDKEAIKEAFKDKREPLIKYPGALGKFLKGAFERDAFISFLAPEKRGKSLLLADVAYRAVLQKRKVVYFEAGDMSQNQIMRRLMTRVAKWPMKRSLVKYPISIERGAGNDDDAEVEYKTLAFRRPLDYKIAHKACRKLLSQKLHSQEELFKLSCHPNSSLSVKGIKSILESWERDGWVPDVIVIDYADIMNMDHHGLEGRDQINNTWKQLRGVSQQYHCLVVTATQSNAASYKAETIDRTNFSEDKRKMAHVTGMIGINQSDIEKERGVIRLNWIVLRDADYDTSKCVYVATCYPLGNPTVRSCF